MDVLILSTLGHGLLSVDKRSLSHFYFLCTNVFLNLNDSSCGYAKDLECVATKHKTNITYVSSKCGTNINKV